MSEGFREQRDMKERVHLETLRLLRYNAYTTLCTTPTKKGYKHPKLRDFYPLPFDRQEGDMPTKEEQIESWLQLDVYISNGKKRGYTDYNGNLFKDREGKQKIGYIENDEIQYIN